MSLPTHAARTLFHTRQTVFHGYLREDGLWDIEAHLHDAKTYPLTLDVGRALPAGVPVHDMRIRVTVDDRMVVRDIAASMDSAPAMSCQQTLDPLRGLIGCVMGRGWRKAIDQHLGGVLGCEHLRAMLFNMATAAYQTIPAGVVFRDRGVGELPEVKEGGDPPPHLGQCLTWDLSGPAVERRYPMFFRDPKARDAA